MILRRRLSLNAPSVSNAAWRFALSFRHSQMRRSGGGIAKVHNWLANIQQCVILRKAFMGA
jgi:hypothetical protein